MFPDGPAGLALIVLRACVLVSLWMTASPKDHFVSSWPVLGLSLICMLIAAGAFTPFVCTFSIAIELWSFWHGDAADPWHVIIAPLLTIVLALLGPGAFSIDAKLFGRRRIVVDGD
jgi:hypothetical protein